MLGRKIKNKKPTGFALVSTILLMILLTIIALGTLSLSAVSIRNSSQTSATMQAQANARMALMIAIGELQKQMGPDQRISANSDILEEDPTMIQNLHWTGVWNSWKAGTGEGSQHTTITGVADSMAPTYLKNRSDYFRRWLVSLTESEASQIQSPVNLALGAVEKPSGSQNAVFLVSDGSLGDDAALEKDYVAARLINITDGKSGTVAGRYGWWVGDESQKARILEDSYESSASLSQVDKYYRVLAPAATGTKTASGLNDITTEKQLGIVSSLKSIDLLDGVAAPEANQLPSKTNFFHVTPFSQSVIADVREGGLKRDLSVLLERPISIGETSDDFMLYRFDNAGEARVPIQDLAAYYQLYHNDPNWSNGRRGGINYDSSAKSYFIKVPNNGTGATRDKYLREYTSLYSSPVPVRIRYILALGAQPISGNQWTHISTLDANGNVTATTLRGTPLRPTDTHRLVLGVIPVLSLWNPNNVPMVLERGNRMAFKMGSPPFGIRLIKHRFNTATSTYTTLPPNPGDSNGYFNLNFALNLHDQSDGTARVHHPHVMQFKFAETRDVRFEPGEVKIFSMPPTGITSLGSGSSFATGMHGGRKEYEPVEGWDPYNFFTAINSCTYGGSGDQDSTLFAFQAGGASARAYTFNANDRFSIAVATEDPVVSQFTRGLAISRANEVTGAGFNFWFGDYDHCQITNLMGATNSNPTFHFRNYQFLSRFGGAANRNSSPFTSAFNSQMMRLGFPAGAQTIPPEPVTNAISGSSLILAATNANLVQPFLMFSMAAGCEANNTVAGGFASGRKFASRPFLHSSTISAPLVDQTSATSLYNFGWEWQVEPMNGFVGYTQVIPGTNNDYFGGGYSASQGVSHVVQQHLPILPPISIAALSSAHLGGFSLANQPVVGGATDNIRFYPNWGSDILDPLRSPKQLKDFQCVTATGAGGLAPHVMQAIGNSYAHPNIPSNVASTTYTRDMSINVTELPIPFVDHSYLANKALWDDYFFSSLTPQTSAVPQFLVNRSLSTVAQDFFFSRTPLPNRRVVTYTTNGLTADKLNGMLGLSNQFNAGLADQIAQHLMVMGGFNINSTSVDAWKVLLSSLKGKPISYVNEAGATVEEVPSGVPVSSGIHSNGPVVSSTDITDGNQPAEQWIGGRMLSDSEIDQLAIAMVKQVRQRGPFLSLSEFVNRRLEGSSSPHALKGALQAALDDTTVDINKPFRTPSRILDSETASVTPAFAFPDAAKGPIAYGSSAYVDQADVLRHFAEQLTPRGDTFVIRTYGDALDKNGKVIARAWCEAVVQRTPDYVNGLDAPYLKQADASLSSVSKLYGRKLVIAYFRWLSADEV